MMKIKFFYYFFLSFILISCGVSKSLKHVPEISSYSLEQPKVEKINDSVFYFKYNFLAKNSHQIWEMYNAGNALQLGYNNGALSQDLMHYQEKVFFDKVKDFVPSKFKQKILRNTLQWYTRNMYKNIRNDFQAELLGISQYSSDEFDFVAPKFQRSLSLHAAHDIGHALQDLMIVGCSSLAVWDENSENGELLIGRAFDFYAGDDFSKNKMIQFVKPDDGIPFMSVSWPGMLGVASGMNKNGITVTINAGKSKIPLSAKTPISLVTREILQFASTIDEAIEIAKKRKVFVSESILVGSGKERKAVIIEVSPKDFGVYKVQNSPKLICTNHFQSETFKNDKKNLNQIENSHSEYRYERLDELISQNEKLSLTEMASILRNRFGLKEEIIGNGNEKAINQLLAHHAVIFSPEKSLVWVSANPYQLGEFVSYDLNKIFSETPKIGNLESKEYLIPKDDFIDSQEFKNYENYRKQDRILDDAIKFKKDISEEFINNYIELNPELWIVYFKSGKYFYEKGNYEKAKMYFEKSLSKVISSIPEKENVEKYLKKSKWKI